MIDLDNNIIKQLTPRLVKLIEGIAYVFWVDLGYRLRSRLTVPLQGSWGMTDIPSVLLLLDYFHIEITVTVTECLAIRPDSAPRNRGHGLGYVWDPPKVWTMPTTD